MVLGRYTTNKGGNSSSTVLAARTTEACTNPNCKAKKRSTHTTANCYWPGGGKEGQFPPGFGQRAKANITQTPTASNTPATAAISSTRQNKTFVLSVQVPETPGQSGVLIDIPTNDPPIVLISKGFQIFGKEVPTFLDSGASDTMFISKDVFTEYTPVTSRIGDSAKAVDGGFEIVGEGNVVQRY